MIVYDVIAKDKETGGTFNTLITEDEGEDEGLRDWEKMDEYLRKNYGLRDDDIHYCFLAGEIGNKDKVETDEFEYKIVGMRWKGVD